MVCLTTQLVPIAARADQFVELDYNISLNSRARNTAFLELFDDRPQTEANFLQYVNNTVTNGSYSGTLMHRLSRNFVIQGGGYQPSLFFQSSLSDYSLDPTATVDLDGNASTSNPTVPGESGNSPARSNLTGTVSMALSTGPNSGTNQWFVNLADNTFLDNASSGGPFTVFAKVTGDGMTLFSAYNTLSITNLNPDYNNDGTRDAGPFGMSSSDGVPYLPSTPNSSLLVLQKAKQIDYLGNGLTTNVPAAGLTFSTRDAYIDTGTTFTGSGSLTIGSGRTLGIREQYSLNRSLSNHGTLAPGLQLGAVTVQSNYLQYFDGTLNIQLAGTTADTLYDKLNVTGTAFLDGKLSVSFVGSYAPVAGNSYTVLSAASIVGFFGSYDLPQLSPGLVWSAAQSSTTFTLSVIAADYNHNGVVDAADYVLWRKTKGMSVTPYSGADGNGDGIVNDADYLVWRNNIGNVSAVSHGAGSGSLLNSAVPEPSSIVLGLFCAVVLGMFRRR